LALKIIGYDGKKFNVGYEIRNHDAPKDILFLHGWGATRKIMEQAFGERLGRFRHIYLDLPGFGKSSPPPAPFDSFDYAEVVRRFLQEIGAAPKIVVGHSFGGKIATLLAPDLLVLLASAGIVWPKPLKVRAKIALYKRLKPFGKGLRRYFVSEDAKGMSEVMYETFKRVVDEDFRPHYAAYGGKALLFWGDRDTATPLKSAYEIQRLIPKSRLRVLEGDHYFFLRHGGAIAKEIEDEEL